MSAERDLYSRLVDAATDTELPFIEDAARRAGIIWECHCQSGYVCWTNREDDKTCGSCGKPRKRRRKIS